MQTYVKIEKNRYIDSLQTLLGSSILNEQPGIQVGYVGMATLSFKEILAEIGLLTDEIRACGDGDYIVAASADSEANFLRGVQAVDQSMAPEQSTGAAVRESFTSVRAAAKAHPEANLCSIAVPGEYALSEVKKALNAGLHCVVFSNNVPLSDEREMKELAREKGLLCMGPDCGVANIDGAALVLASINARGIQHVAAILHEAGTGVSQTIGTGGNDLKNAVGGIMMLMGIDALEADPETKYIALISRRPGDEVLPKVLERISRCQKPVVVFFMGLCTTMPCTDWKNI